MKRLTTFIIVLFVFIYGFADLKPRDAVYSAKQSDGTTLTVINNATRELHYYTTADGFLLECDSKGDYFYVVGYEGGNYVVSDVLAHDAGQRSEEEIKLVESLPSSKELIEKEMNSSFRNGHTPLKAIGVHEEAPLMSQGSPKIPVLLVQFSDLSFTVKSTDAELVDLFDKFTNGDGSGNYYTGAGSIGSVSEYFRDQSSGVFTPEFVVIGPLTLDKSYSYYGANTASKKDVNISEFYMDAIQKALESYSGWNEFDNDNNGTVDMAFFIFAGPGENQSGISKEHIWPKENPDGGTVGDTEIGCYACCGELTYDEFAGIGTFCHELSHALGLTDTYDYNGVAYGMGYWDLMDSGCYNKNDQAPCDYTAYQKDFMGWRDIVTIDPSVKQTLTLKPISDGGVGYKIVNPENVDEYYIIENRQNLNWDKYVGLSTDVFGYHHGMTVCHIDYSYEAWTNNIVNCDASHQRMTLVPGDGELTPTTEYTSGAISAEEFINGIGGDVFPGNAYADQLKGVKMPLFTSAGHCSYSLNDIWEHSDGTVTVKIGFTDILDRPSIKSAKDYLVNWTSVENAQSYVVQTSSSPQFKSDLSTDSVANVLQTTLSGLSESSVYLRVRALSDDVLNSEWSPIVILSNGNLKLLSVGDVNADGYVNVADIISMVNYFLAGDVFVNPDTSDINGDGSLSVADIIALISIVAK